MKKIIILLSIALLDFFFTTSYTFATSGACSSHLGVNCNVYDTHDASVICNDGWKDSSVLYIDAQECKLDCSIYDSSILSYGQLKSQSEYQLSAHSSCQRVEEYLKAKMYAAGAQDSSAGLTIVQEGVATCNQEISNIQAQISQYADKITQLQNDDYSCNAFSTNMTETTKTILQNLVQSQQKTCSQNSHESLTDSTLCQCDVGYQINSTKDACIPIPPVKTNDQICQYVLGVNSYWDGTKTNNGFSGCLCGTGYILDGTRSTGDRCVIAPVQTNISDFGTTSTLSSPDTTNIIVSPKNFTVKKTTKSILAKWKSIPSSKSYEYVLTPNLYTTVEQLNDNETWHQVSKPSINFSITKNRKNKKLYLYVDFIDKYGYELAIRSIGLQF
jgi:hypothetical protein